MCTEVGHFDYWANLQNKFTILNGAIKEIEYENQRNLITHVKYALDNSTLSMYSYIMTFWDVEKIER